MGDERIVFVGLFVSANSLKELSVWRGYLTVEDGKVTKKGTSAEYEKLKLAGYFSSFKIVQLKDGQFVMPGFVDCHTHAPQFPNIGLGLDRPLLEWLAKYTFPLESRYSDLDFAAAVYEKVVQRLLTNGTTTACYFGSLHLQGTLALVRCVTKHHQRALVGKVSMNLSNDAGYYNDTATEVEEVEAFVKEVLAYKNDLVQPVVTPRFAVSCDLELLTALADIAERYDCRIQSHISENLSEIEYVLQQFPSCKSYGDVYDKSNILNKRCIMAHAVHLTDGEVSLLAAKGVSIAHCPASNTRLMSGLCPVKKYLDNNITVGLGTDVSGGDSATILDAMRRTMDVSSHLELTGNGASLDWRAALYLATLGGAKALGLDKKIGSLEEGKDFDALLIDVYANDSAIDSYESLYAGAGDHDESLVQRFVYLGDDRNILQVYVKGYQVKNI